MLVLGLWSPRKEEKKIGGWGNWGYVGIRGDTGGSLTPSTLLSIETLY